ncbi:glycerol-3-phosphate acyltransferase [Cohnella thailandensis]|uniref:Glycerol-3-phosphate acyltransferase n=1 Tax=Cohnella thailandensis TaxID=557557 RepID=A0A841T4E2_9BACL|nr:glycerol-3-phosphate acyltransferase [Cohnella thailandensis]MBB6637706.1 glycerol-3-phosphate acyltransferase [Cohnella thailandensis]MBP1974117.1 acyl-phosphate glycerol 3-phosphate acyltransferase [Cohnella thailandensis]
MIVLWFLIAFLVGSFMFSYWLGRLANVNLRRIGDGNPGGANLWSAAGYPYGLAGIALDFLKGYLAVLLIQQTTNANGFKLILIALAPILGHCFSPFLNWKGGKGIAVTFGVWSALTDFSASLAYAVILALLWLLFRWVHRGRPMTSEVNALQVVLGMLLLAIFLFNRSYEAAILWFWGGNLLLLAITHRRELRNLMTA